MSRAGGLDIVGAVGVRVVPILDDDAMRAITAQIKQRADQTHGGTTATAASTGSAADTVNQAQIGASNAVAAISNAQAATQAVQSESIFASQAVTQAAIKPMKRGPMMTRLGIGKEIKSVIGDEIGTQQEEIESILGAYADPFGWDGPLPGEVKRHKEGAPYKTQLLLRGNVPGGTGADAFGDLGDKLFEYADFLGMSPSAKAAVAGKKSQHPYANWLGTLYDEIGDEGGIETTKIDPNALKSGHSFTAAGIKFPVDEDEYGNPLIRGNDKFNDLPISAIPGKLSIDKGSLRFNAPETFGGGDFAEGLDKPIAMRVDTTGALAEVRALHQEINATKADAERAIVLHPSVRSQSPLEVTHVGALPEADAIRRGRGFGGETPDEAYANAQRRSELKAMGFDPRDIARAERHVQTLREFEAQIGDNPSKEAREFRDMFARNLAETGFFPGQFDEQGRFRTPTTPASSSPLITPAANRSRPRPIVQRAVEPYQGNLIGMPDNDDRGQLSEIYGSAEMRGRYIPHGTPMSADEWADYQWRNAGRDGFDGNGLPPIPIGDGQPDDGPDGKKRRFGEVLRAARPGGNRGGAVGWWGGGGASGLLTQIGGKAGTGLMMSAMFGGWEVATALGSARQLDAATGTPTEVLQQQIMSAQMMRQGPLGSIGGLLVDPFHSTEIFATNTLKSIANADSQLELNSGLRNQARANDAASRIISAPGSVQGLLGLFEGERQQIEGLQPIRTRAAEQARLAGQEIREGAESETVGRRFVGNALSKTLAVGNWIVGRGYEGPRREMAADFNQWLGVSDARMNADREAFRVRDSHLDIANQNIEGLTGSIRNLTREQTNAFIKNFEQQSRTDISGYGPDAAYAQAFFSRQAEMSKLDAEIANAPDQRTKDALREVRNIYSESSKIQRDMIGVEMIYRGQEAEIGGFEKQKRIIREQTDILKSSSWMNETQKQALEYGALFRIDQIDRQGKLAEAMGPINDRITIARATANPFDEQKIALSDEALQAGLKAIPGDDINTRNRMIAGFAAGNEALNITTERYNRRSVRDINNQTAIIDAQMRGGSASAIAEQIALSVESDVADLNEAGMFEQSEARKKLGQRQRDYAEREFYGSFRGFTSSGVYQGFSPTAGQGGGAFEDAERRINSLQTSGDGASQPVEKLEDIKTTANDISAKFDEMLGMWRAFLGGNT